MKKLPVIIILHLQMMLFFNYNSSAAQTLKEINGSFKDPEVAYLVKKGLDESYNFNWTESEKTFRSLISKYPESPVGYHFLSGIYMWYFLGNQNENDFNRFIEISDSAILKFNEIVDSLPPDFELLYIMGANYSYRAIVYAKNSNYLDAIWSTTKTESFLAECIRINPEYYDAYLGLGLYNFAISQIPAAFRWALNLAGIEGDYKTGIKYIRLTANKGVYSKTDAQYYLSQILSDVYLDYTEANKYLAPLASRYPGNLLFNYALASLRIKEHNPKAAGRLLSGIIKQNTSRFINLINLARFLQGDVYFKLNDFKSAINYYSNFLSDYKGKDYRGIAALRLGISYEMLGLRDSAELYYSQSGEGNLDIEDDVYAAGIGEIYLSNPVTEIRKRTIFASNLIEAGEYRKATDSLLILLETDSLNEAKALINYYLSEAYFYQKKYDDCILHAFTTVGYPGDYENWIYPFAYYNTAKAYLKQKNYTDCLRNLEAAGDYNDYYYQNKLENLLSNLKGKLETLAPELFN